ncbi:conserved hypothetical protein [Sulfurihydrogenibium azorense Az-Fu1]|uniref:Uncharacterized protein n=1 Tax=Sulfurihydrogenibium azorense (strain DSM 15241 / OCM 825 / Az-Fu1) TaxID=204536 RepID=C1DUV8_SULAA|nr:FlxA-like family protein [Sulfurihydrogenibium azorense]ACN98176.1 conserved hypothetical protein [Sulfurihydrogenibium azorense Az-Fu1]
MYKKLAVMGLIAGISVSSYANNDEKIKMLEEQIKLLQQQIQELKEAQKTASETKQETEALKEEIRKLRLEFAMPEFENKSYYGLGPAASKAMFNPKGISIGGYGELTFVHNDVNARDGAKSIADMQRFIIYLGYAFNEKLKFNSELELEHSSTSGSHGTGGGYFKTEFAFLDYNFRPEFGVRGGLLLMPVGIINEYHEPPTFPTAQRPFLETRILLSTWDEMGAGIYGKINNLEYKFYITNGLMIKGNGGYSDTQPLKNLIQRGARAVSEKVGFTGRLDYNLFDKVKVGMSFWTGDVQSKGGSDSALGLRRGTDIGNITIISPHLWYQDKGWDVRFVGASVKIDDAKKIGNDLGITRFPSKQEGFYFQVAYDILRLFKLDTMQEFYLFGNYEYLNTHKSVPAGFTKPNGHKLNVYNFGFSYKPHPLVALKADYVRLNYSPNKKDENEYRFTLGFMF